LLILLFITKGRKNTAYNIFFIPHQENIYKKKLGYLWTLFFNKIFIITNRIFDYDSMGHTLFLLIESQIRKSGIIVLWFQLNITGEHHISSSILIMHILNFKRSGLESYIELEIICYQAKTKSTLMGYLLSLITKI
jgi:hypothetical protein